MLNVVVTVYFLRCKFTSVIYLSCTSNLILTVKFLNVDKFALSFLIRNMYFFVVSSHTALNYNRLLSHSFYCLVNTDL
jgi:hypothetical protein